LLTSKMPTATLTPPRVGGMPGPWQVLWALVVMTLLISGMRAQSQSAGEYQVKAAFLYNFAKFVEWPPNSFRDSTAPLQICVLGQDPFGEELRNITNEKTVNGRKFEVREVADLQLAKGCHILFIASSEKAQFKPILEGLRGTYALTVSDTRGFVEQGGMINFVLENDRVQFEVSRRAVEQAGLKISSKLLIVAKLVIV
jgi:YfiR/HmsC-like